MAQRVASLSILTTFLRNLIFPTTWLCFGLLGRRKAGGGPPIAVQVTTGGTRCSARAESRLWQRACRRVPLACPCTRLLFFRLFPPPLRFPRLFPRRFVPWASLPRSFSPRPPPSL